jgi:SPP1 gp7 family putative phage head morphogenesis protein
MKKKKQRDPFQTARSAEAEFARALRGIAAEVGRLVASFVHGVTIDYPPLRDALDRYADLIRPWAERKAEIIVGQVDAHNRKVWFENSAQLSHGMRRTILSTPVGVQFRELVGLQTALITSIPTKAAARVQKLVQENIVQGGRSTALVPGIEKEILKSGKVAKSRATMIARTETARAQSVLTEARAKSIGSTGYIWRTVHDADVRPSHKKMEGQYVAWNDPPTLDGLTGHAGCLPNCRCYPEPVIPKELLE